MDKSDSLKLGIHLRRLREERKLTLGGVEALSEGAGERVNKSYLFRVEHGKTVPTIPRLKALAKVYHVRLGTFLEVLEEVSEEREREASVGVDLKKVSFQELRSLGIGAEREGDFSRATLYYRAAWDQALLDDASPERSVKVAKARHDLAVASKKAGRLEVAREQAEAALEEDGIPSPLLDSIRLNLADVYRRLGRFVLAQWILDGLLSKKDRLPRELLAGANSVMGSVMLRREPKGAAVYYRSALSLLRHLKDRYEECKLLYNIGLAESKCGNFARSSKVLHKAQDLARRKDYNFLLTKIQAEIGKSLYLKGEPQRARQALRDAMELARQRDYYEQLFICQYYLRRLALGEGDEIGARTSEGSLKFFASRIEESFEELEAFKAELQDLKGVGR